MPNSKATNDKNDWICHDWFDVKSELRKSGPSRNSKFDPKWYTTFVKLFKCAIFAAHKCQKWRFWES